MPDDQRNPLEGVKLDRYVMREGGFWQYQHPPYDWDRGAECDTPLEEVVPPAAHFAQRGRWFTEDRAEQLLDYEFRYEGCCK